MKLIKLTQEELQAVIDCVSITDESIKNEFLTIRIIVKERLNKINLKDLFSKLCDEYEKG